MHSLLLVLGLSIFIQPMLTIRCWFNAELSAKHIFAANNVAFIVATITRISLILFRRPLVDFAWTSVAETIVAAVCLWIFYHQTGAKVYTWHRLSAS